MLTAYVIKGKPQKSPKDAAISALHAGLKKFEKGAQAVHVIFANIVPFGRTWRAVVEIIREQDVDKVFSEPIVFGHLPEKYEDIYDDLLPEVDHLNLIMDESIWKKIELYLLDIYFYQAVNPPQSNQTSQIDTKGLKGFHKTNDIDPDLKAFMTGKMKYNLHFDKESLRFLKADHCRALADAEVRAAYDRWVIWRRDIDVNRVSARSNSVVTENSTQKVQSLLRELKKS